MKITLLDRIYSYTLAISAIWNIFYGAAHDDQNRLLIAALTLIIAGLYLRKANRE